MQLADEHNIVVNYNVWSKTDLLFPDLLKLACRTAFGDSKSFTDPLLLLFEVYNVQVLSRGKGRLFCVKPAAAEALANCGTLYIELKDPQISIEIIASNKYNQQLARSMRYSIGLSAMQLLRDAATSPALLCSRQ